MLSFHFLFTGKPIPACPLLASEWYSRWPLWIVVKNCPLFFGHLRALSRPISCCFISVLLQLFDNYHKYIIYTGICIAICVTKAKFGEKIQFSSDEDPERNRAETSRI